MFFKIYIQFLNFSDFVITEHGNQPRLLDSGNQHFSLSFAQLPLGQLLRKAGWYLDKDLAPQIFWGRQPPGPVSFDVGQVQFVSEDFNQILGHLLLLRDTAVVLYGQDDRVAET